MPAGSFELNTIRGVQDEELTGNPEITFFKSKYSRYTNFTMELIKCKEISVDFGKRVSITLPRNGDLVKDTFLEIELSNTSTHCYGLGNALIKSASIEIGGQRIEQLTGSDLNIIGELMKTGNKRRTWDKFVGNISGTESTNRLIIPLPFFYAREMGLSLPLIGLQYHEARVNIEFSSREELLLPDDCKFVSCSLLNEYVYLDTEERRRFAQGPHEYLVEIYNSMWWGITGDGPDSYIKEDNFIIRNMPFNHPTKVLYFYASIKGQPCQSASLHTNTETQFSLTYNTKDETVLSMETLLNYNAYRYNINSPRETMKIPIKQYVEPELKPIDITDISSAANTTAPEDSATTQEKETKLLKDSKTIALEYGKKYNQHIYTYSNGLEPSKWTPSGTMNYSRIDNISLEIKNVNLPGNVNSFGVMQINYNILKVMSGMASLAYAS